METTETTPKRKSTLPSVLEAQLSSEEELLVPEMESSLDADKTELAKLWEEAEKEGMAGASPIEIKQDQVLIYFDCAPLGSYNTGRLFTRPSEPLPQGSLATTIRNDGFYIPAGLSFQARPDLEIVANRLGSKYKECITVFEKRESLTQEQGNLEDYTPEIAFKILAKCTSLEQLEGLSLGVTIPQLIKRINERRSQIEAAERGSKVYQSNVYLTPLIQAQTVI